MAYSNATPENSRFAPCDPHLQKKVIEIHDALNLIQNNARIVTAMAAAEPAMFFEELARFAQLRTGLEVSCANPSRYFDCFKDDAALKGRLSLRVMFLTTKVRDCQGHDRIHYVPQHLSQWTRNVLAGGEVDVFWGTCSLPDSRGFVSLGLSCCYESEIIRRAKVKILEINPRMPVTFGATSFPEALVDYFVYSDAPLPGFTPAEPTEIDMKIGAYIADQIADGSTIQLGIGGIPNAVGKLLESKKDLGIHSEMLNDALIALHKCGAVTNMKKSIWPGKSVASFAFGSPELYEFLDKNPAFEFQPSSVINDPYRIGRNYRMVSINTAIEVDLTGQVCSESIGHRELSGVGGAADTHIGAQRSEGGIGIIALPSTTKDGDSKIVFELKPGAKVSISRNDVDTIITEYGIACLRGKSVAQRVRSMCEIAHPKFRDELLAQAMRHGYL